MTKNLFIILMSLIILISLISMGFAQEPVRCGPQSNGQYILCEKIPGFPEAVGGVADYIGQVFRYALMIGGIVVFLRIIYGGLMHIFSGGNPAKQNDARDVIWQAIWGLGLLIGSYLILYTINPELVTLREIPGAMPVDALSNPGFLTGELPEEARQLDRNISSSRQTLSALDEQIAVLQGQLKTETDANRRQLLEATLDTALTEREKEREIYNYLNFKKGDTRAAQWGEAADRSPLQSQDGLPRLETLRGLEAAEATARIRAWLDISASHPELATGAPLPEDQLGAAYDRYRGRYQPLTSQELNQLTQETLGPGHTSRIVTDFDAQGERLIGVNFPEGKSEKLYRETDLLLKIEESRGSWKNKK